MARLFGTDGVRGIANTELTPELAFRLGWAAAYYFGREHADPQFMIGRDTRVSGQMLEAALAAGICSAGGHAVLLGVIPTVTGPFCAACDRTRITADGQIRTCLFSRTETDLRTPLRHGASDLELAELWARAQGLKAPAHGIGEPGFVQPTRTMSAIGG